MIVISETAVEEVWQQYLGSLDEEKRFLLSRYKIVDGALRVGGVGSVGTRCLILLLQGGADDDGLIVQLKEAGPSALEAYLPPHTYSQYAQRVVIGQQLMQTTNDIFLGWHKSQNLGSDAFAMGPAVIFLLMPGNWVVGVTANHTWTFANDKNYNQTFIQYFITYNIKNGWYVNTNPMITANWNAPVGNEWTMPVGAGGGKVFHAGKQAMKLQGQVYYNAIAPPGAADWTFQIQYVLLFPHK